jgi:hypothetical protein
MSTLIRKGEDGYERVWIHLDIEKYLLLQYYEMNQKKYPEPLNWVGRGISNFHQPSAITWQTHIGGSIANRNIISRPYNPGVSRKTEISKKENSKIDDFLNTVLKFSQDSKFTKDDIKKFLVLVVELFFTENKTIIKSVYREFKDEPLQYTLFLSDESMRNHSKIYSFLNKYEETGLNKKYPIFITILPNEIEQILTFDNQIIL